MALLDFSAFSSPAPDTSDVPLPRERPSQPGDAATPSAKPAPVTSGGLDFSAESRPLSLYDNPMASHAPGGETRYRGSGEPIHPVSDIGHAVAAAAGAEPMPEGYKPSAAERIIGAGVAGASPGEGLAKDYWTSAANFLQKHADYGSAQYAGGAALLTAGGVIPTALDLFGRAIGAGGNALAEAGAEVIKAVNDTTGQPNFAGDPEAFRSDALNFVNFYLIHAGMEPIGEAAGSARAVGVPARQFLYDARDATVAPSPDAIRGKVVNRAAEAMGTKALPPPGYVAPEVQAAPPAGGKVQEGAAGTVPPGQMGVPPMAQPTKPPEVPGAPATAPPVIVTPPPPRPSTPPPAPLAAPAPSPSGGAAAPAAGAPPIVTAAPQARPALPPPNAIVPPSGIAPTQKPTGQPVATPPVIAMPAERPPVTSGGVDFSAESTPAPDVTSPPDKVTTPQEKPQAPAASAPADVTTPAGNVTSPPGLQSYHATEGAHAVAEPARVEKEIADPAVAKHLTQPAPIDRGYDIPYLAGYAKDGKTVFIDRHLPAKIDVGGKMIDPRPFLYRHERVEKALIDAKGYTYQGAHEIATGAEHALLRSKGIDPAAYEAALKPFIKHDQHERLTRVPSSLDMTPYNDTQAKNIEARMQQAGAPANVAQPVKPNVAEPPESKASLRSIAPEKAMATAMGRPYSDWIAKIEDIDAHGEPDSAYRSILSTGSKETRADGRPKGAETWREKVLQLIRTSHERRAPGKPASAPEAAPAPTKPAPKLDAHGPLKEPFDQYIARLQREADAFHAEVMTAIKEDGIYVSKGPNGRVVTVTPSNREPGLYQVTNFHNGEATGHIEARPDMVGRETGSMAGPGFTQVRGAEADAAFEAPAAKTEAPKPKEKPKAKPTAPAKPVSLARFLKQHGGLKDESGELKHAGIHKQFPGLVNNKTGLPHDRAREIAAEAGYMDHLYGNPQAAMRESTPADLRAMLPEADKAFPRVDLERPAETAPKPAKAAEEARARQAIEAALADGGMKKPPADLVAHATAILAERGDGDPEGAIERAIAEIEAHTLTPARAKALDEALPPGWEDDAHATEPFTSGERAPENGGKAGEPAGGGGPEASRGAPPDRGAAQVEKTEAGSQTVLPGAERIGEGELAKRKAAEPLKPKVAQKAADHGLFSDEKDQTDLVDMARAKEKPQPRAVASAPPAAKPPTRIEDAGEKIGGARKDRWRERGLTESDLDGMTPTEEFEHVRKDNIWKAPDYPALIDSGVTPETAAAIKLMRDRLAAKPKKDSAEERRRYLKMVGIIRDQTMKAKSISDLRGLQDRVLHELGWNDKDRQGYAQTETRSTLFSAFTGRTAKFNLTGYSELRRIAEMLAEGWPKAAKKERPKGEDGKPKLPERPHLDEVRRTGKEVRNGRNIGSEDFGKDFGFRAVEFGNWVASDERQKVVNLAYEALHDLAEVLDLPPRALSLNDSLALAFGARGSGAARAHYEPGRLVINMTKLSGAGSLAHEWAHALDHYYGTLNKDTGSRGAPQGASGWYDRGDYSGKPRPRIDRATGKTIEERRLGNLRPEMADAFNRVMATLFEKNKAKAEVVRALELDIESANGRIAKQEERLATARDGMTPKDFAKFKKQSDDYIDQTRRMVAIKEKRLGEIRNDPRDNDPSFGKEPTRYAREAQHLSGKSVSGYWTRPTEMFARAFEAYVQDKIGLHENVSEYLVHGTAGGVFTRERGFKGDPYPEGEERQAFNEAFDNLVQTIDKITEPGGSVRLGSTASREPAVRQHGLPPDIPVSSRFRSDGPLKAHPDYRAAKAGDPEAAGRLVEALVPRAALSEAAQQFGGDAVYVPVIAQEATGRNKIPEAIANYYAAGTGARAATAIVQSSRAYHTGARPLERLIARPVFDGPVEDGGRYVLVDDVTVMGGSLSELANHIQEGGGEVIGVVTLVNASRSGVKAVSKTQARAIERRYGDAVRTEFGIEPSALTADEATYILGFRDADALRGGIAKARGEREQRLLSKGIQPPEAEGEVEPPKGSSKLNETAVGEHTSRPVPRVKIPAEARANLERSLANIVKQIFGKDVAISFAKTLPYNRDIGEEYDAGMARAAAAGGRVGTTMGGEAQWNTSGHALVKLATDDPKFDPTDSAYHEPYHLVEGLLMSDKEMEAVTSPSEMAKARALAKERLNWKQEAIDALPGYEVRAIGFAEYARRRNAGETIDPKLRNSVLGRFYERLMHLLARIRRVLFNKGFSKLEDIFEDVYQGRMADRPREYRDLLDLGNAAEKDAPMAENLPAPEIKEFKPGAMTLVSGGKALATAKKGPHGWQITSHIGDIWPASSKVVRPKSGMTNTRFAQTKVEARAILESVAGEQPGKLSDLGATAERRGTDPLKSIRTKLGNSVFSQDWKQEKEFNRWVSDLLYRIQKRTDASVIDMKDRFNAIPDEIRNPESMERLYKYQENINNPGGRPTLSAAEAEYMKGDGAALKKLERENWVRATTLAKELDLTPAEIAELADASNPEYMHKMVVGKTPQFDVLQGREATSSPIFGGRSLRQKTGSMEKTVYRAVEWSDGTREVAVKGKDGIYLLQKGGRVKLAGTSAATKFDVGAKITSKSRRTGTVVQSRTHPIEESTKTRYYKDFFVNTADNILRLERVVENLETMKAIRESDDFLRHATTGENESAPKDWKRTNVPGLKNYYLAPKLRHVVEDFVEGGPRLFHGDLADRLDAINRVVIGSLFVTPFPHIENVGWHAFTGRGWEWAPWNAFTSYPRLIATTVKATRAVLGQSPVYRDYLRSGSPLLYSRSANHDFIEFLFQGVGHEIEKNESLLQKIGGKTGITAYYSGVRQVMWAANDIFMLQRIMELERKGLSREEAIRETAKHIPDYRIPSEVLNSRAVAQIIGERGLFNFGPYAYGRLKSYGHVISDMRGLVGAGGKTFKQGVDALGIAVAIGVLVAVIIPYMTKLAQQATGDKEAHKMARGPATIPQLALDVASGKHTLGQAALTAFSPNPVPLEIFQQIFNRDLYLSQYNERTGQIVKDKDTYEEGILHRLEHAAGELPLVQMGEEVWKKGFLDLLGSMTIGVNKQKPWNPHPAVHY